MIVVEEKRDLLEVHVHGELTLAVYREFEQAVGRELKKAPKIRLLLDLANMAGYTLDVAWEEIKFARAHAPYRLPCLPRGSMREYILAMCS